MAIAATNACTLGCVAKKHDSKEIKSTVQLCQSLHPKALECVWVCLEGIILVEPRATEEMQLRS